MFRKIGNPKNTLRNNCVGLRHGREYGPYFSRRVVSLARFDVPKNLQKLTFGIPQTVGEYETFPPIRTVVPFVFPYLSFSETPRWEGQRDVFLNTARSPLRIPLPWIQNLKSKNLQNIPSGSLNTPHITGHCP